jgi:hypothetical protein
MKILKLLPVILSFIILAAHFSRAGILALAILSLLLPFLLLIKKPYSARIIQIALILGALEWIRTLIVYVLQRIEENQSYFRLILILLFVALFTGLSALIFRIKSIKEIYKI